MSILFATASGERRISGNRPDFTERACSYGTGSVRLAALSHNRSGTILADDVPQPDVPMLPSAGAICYSPRCNKDRNQVEDEAQCKYLPRRSPPLHGRWIFSNKVSSCFVFSLRRVLVPLRFSIATGWCFMPVHQLHVYWAIRQKRLWGAARFN